MISINFIKIIKIIKMKCYIYIYIDDDDDDEWWLKGKIT